MLGIRSENKNNSMSIKNKITKQLAIIGGISIGLTVILTIIVYYSMYRKQVFEDLNTNARIVMNVFSVDGDNKELYFPSREGIRVTVVNQEGIVLYDNFTDISEMENHRNRPEIKSAFLSGEGKSIRHSDTLDIDTYYYAVRLDDNTILRIAKDANSILALFYETIPFLLLGASFVFGVCLVMSRVLTKRIVTPIEQMTSKMKQYEEFHESVPYEELRPFASTIWEQHENIRLQLNKLEKSDRMRQEFTANVSHELKTPLTSISGYAELIESGMTKAEDLNRFGGEIRKNATRLLHLINDILELSELDEAEINVTKEDIDLFEVAKKCVDTLALSAQKHEVELSLQGSKSMVYANKEMMEELINNLCDNAIRYNRSGGKVMVSVKPDSHYTKLIVQDTGIGIPKKHLQRIFERFYRVDKSRSKETGGTGLGLAIVKHIVAKHGDRLSIESEVGIGTTISVEL